MTHRLERRDLLWTLAFPLYLLLGTLRHEGSHAIVGLLEGASIERFSIVPRWGEHVGLVKFSAPVSWRCIAAPYLCDLATFIACWLIVWRASLARHWLWANALILGVVSPLVNSASNYFAAFPWVDWTPGGFPIMMMAGDVGSLLRTLPRDAVHAYFLATIALYAAGLLAVLWRSFDACRRARYNAPSCGAATTGCT